MRSSVDAQLREAASTCRRLPSINSRGARVAHYPEMPLRCTRRILPALALLATFAAAPAFAASGPLVQRVGIERPATSTGSYRIGIEGTAAGGCVPHVEGVTVDGADISVVLT